MEFDLPARSHANAPALQVTMSIGVATLMPERETLLELLTRADHALYTAKASGRNRVCAQGQNRDISHIYTTPPAVL